MSVPEIIDERRVGRQFAYNKKCGNDIYDKSLPHFYTITILMSLLHQSTSVNFHQDTALHIQVAHQ